MKINTAKSALTLIGFLLLSLLLPTCSKKSPPKITASSLGLGEAVEDMGTDPNGNLWFRPTTEDASKPDHRWMYNPTTKSLYDATKNEKTGEWDMKERAEVTAKDLGLPADTNENGKDALGRYWFKIPSGGPDKPEQDVIYDTKTKTLLNAKKDPKTGEWHFTPRDSSARK